MHRLWKLQIIILSQKCIHMCIYNLSCSYLGLECGEELHTAVGAEHTSTLHVMYMIFLHVSGSEYPLVVTIACMQLCILKKNLCILFCSALLASGSSPPSVKLELTMLLHTYTH